MIITIIGSISILLKTKVKYEIPHNMYINIEF